MIRYHQKQVESTMEFTMLKKQKYDEDLYKENEKLKKENMVHSYIANS